jgi:hypothetical protein
MNAVRKPDGEARRISPNRLRLTMYWLALDWIQLRSMPEPGSRSAPKVSKMEFARVSNVPEIGHPAEWASDKASEIVAVLSGWHDYLAEERKEKQPTKRIIFGTDEFRSAIPAPASEQRRLIAAWRYLEPRCEQLVELVEAEALKEIPDLHFRIRRTLGLWAPKYTLPIPCPNSDCGLKTLIRVNGVGRDFISCDSCGYTIKEVHYPLLIRMTLDAFLSGVS